MRSPQETIDAIVEGEYHSPLHCSWEEHLVRAGMRAALEPTSHDDNEPRCACLDEYLCEGCQTERRRALGGSEDARSSK